MKELSRIYGLRMTTENEWPHKGHSHLVKGMLSNMCSVECYCERKLTSKFKMYKTVSIGIMNSIYKTRKRKLNNGSGYILWIRPYFWVNRSEMRSQIQIYLPKDEILLSINLTIISVVSGSISFSID